MNDLAPVTIDAFVERFLRLVPAQGAASPRTIEAYRYNIAAFSSWCRDRATDPMTASNEDIMTYRAEIAGKYARATVKLRLTSVRMVYTALQRWGARQDNPAAGVRAPKAKESEAMNIIARSLTPDQAKRLLVEIETAPLRERAMLRLMLMHGVRVGEASRAHSDDLNAGILKVHGKGNKIRLLILSGGCALDLAALPPGFMFANGRGVGLSVRSIERIVNRYFERCGFKEAGKSAHALRHVAAMLAVLGGASREALAESMGHSNITTTDRYCRAAAAYQENPVNAVERALR